MVQKLIDLTGLRFGRWTVDRIELDPRHMTRWQCVCDCGSRKIVVGAHLKTGQSKSCGCLRVELRAEQPPTKQTHGMSAHPAYRSWKHMRERCTSPSSKDYPFYGARGITVCERWSDFALFWADMGPTWKARLTLDRIDVNGNYDPANCRWATQQQQNNNRRPCVMVETSQGLMSAADASRLYGFNDRLIMSRINRGWTGEDLFRPVNYYKRWHK